jgi:hypothetical protein
LEGVWKVKINAPFQTANGGDFIKTEPDNSPFRDGMLLTFKSDMSFTIEPPGIVPVGYYKWDMDKIVVSTDQTGTMPNVTFHFANDDRTRMESESNTGQAPIVILEKVNR